MRHSSVIASPTGTTFNAIAVCQEVTAAMNGRLAIAIPTPDPKLTPEIAMAVAISLP
jgi:hypothetical protein